MADAQFKMKVYFREEGGHTHLRIFTGKGHPGMAGCLTMTNEEFAAWKNGTIKIEWVDDDHD